MNLFEATAKLAMDTSDFIKGLRSAQNSMNDSKKSLSEYRSDVAKLAQQYKQSGMTSSEAWKKAYSEIDKSLYNLNGDVTASGAKIKSFGDVFGTIREKVFSAFSGIKSATETAKDGISVFSDVLKANLLSGVVEKGAENIISAFNKISDAAKNFVMQSVSVGESFDTAMSQVYATMGDKATKEIEYNGQVMQSSEALRQFAKEMGATTKYSATESAQALNYMALAGYDAETSMAMLPNVMNLASAGAFDLARASDMLTDTQTAFGISLERTNQMVDEMAAAASNSNTSVAQLGDAFLTVGGLAKELNGGFVTLANGTTKPVDGVQELEIALGAMANAGIKGSEAGTHMRNLLMKLSAPTEDATKLFDELGLSVFDDAGNMKSLKDVFGEMNRAFKDMGNQQKKLQAISEIFNARDTASATALLAAVEQSWDSLGEAILNAEGAAEKMSQTQMDNLAGAKKIFDSAKEGLQISISDALTPTVTKFVKFGAESLQSLTDTIEKEGTKGLRETISKIVKNAGIVLYKNIPELLKNTVKVLTAIKNGIADGLPVFIDYARATIATIAQNMEKELPEFIKAGQRITSEIGKGITKNFSYIIEAVFKVAKTISKSISQNLPVIIPAITSGILTIIDELTKPERITNFIDAGIELAIGLADGIGKSASILVEKIPDIVENLEQGFEDNKDKLKGTAGTILLSAITDGIGEISFSDTVDSIITGLSNALDGEKWESVKEKISKGIQNIDFSEITSNLSKLIIGITDSAGNLIDGIDWTVLGGAIGEALNGVDWYGILESVFNAISTAIKNAPELLKGIANTIDSETATQIATIGLNLLMGKQIVGGIATYISSTAAFTTVSTALSGLLAKCTPVIGAAIVGWDIGTLIRDEILSEETISKIDETVYQIIDTFKDMGYRIKATFKSIESIFDVDSPYREMTQDQIYKSIALEETAGGTGFQSEGFNKKVLSWGQDLAANFGKGVSDSKEIENAIQDKLNWIHDNMGFSEPKEGPLSDFHTYAPDMVQLFAKGIQENTYLVKNRISELGENIKIIIYNTIDTAVSWGSDMINNFISGINQKWNDAVNVVSDFANMIASFIGFSEPEKGPLSDFHTFAPDMMQLFAQGMKENQKFVVNQAEMLAGNLADIFQNPITADTEITEFELPELPDASYHIELIADLIDNVSEKLREITGMKPVIETTFSEIEEPEITDLIQKIGFSTEKIPEPPIHDILSRISFISDDIPEFLLPDITSKIGFEYDNIPDFQNQDVEIKFIDNLDNIIDKIKNLTDKIINVEAETSLTQVQKIISPEYDIPAIPELSVTTDMSIIDKIKELIENPLVLSVQFTDGFENIRDMFTGIMLEIPEIANLQRDKNGYIKQIDDIKNNYSTTNNYYRTENSNYETSKNYSAENTQQRTIIQNLNISIPSFNVNSPDDISDLVSKAIREIDDQLTVLHIQDSRGYGGVGWT